MKNGFTQIVLVVLLLGVSLAFAYYYGTQQATKPVVVGPSPESTPVASPTATATPQPSPTANVPAGWQTFTSQAYGFSISFPAQYKALTDAKNLYGWPNAVVLIYGGGQSYDLVIEHWNNQADYQAKYPNQNNLVVKQMGNVYITLLNMNFEPEVDQIIATFTNL